MNERSLPGGFEALESFTDWALEEEDDRISRRQASGIDAMRAFYDAMTLLGELHVAKRSFAIFPALASEMGSRNWRRIEYMAEAALRARKRALAIEVFTAADQPGWHRDHLRKRCKELTGVLPAHGAPRSPDGRE